MLGDTYAQSNKSGPRKLQSKWGEKSYIETRLLKIPFYRRKPVQYIESVQVYTLDSWTLQAELRQDCSRGTMWHAKVLFPSVPANQQLQRMENKATV